jgi:hypothetical protein
MASKTGKPCRHRATRPEPIPECVGESIPCWDAKRRVWQALDLLQHHVQTSIHPPASSQPPSSPMTAALPMMHRPRRRHAER